MARIRREAAGLMFSATFRLQTRCAGPVHEWTSAKISLFSCFFLACLTPLIYNGLFLVTLNAMTLFPNLRRLQARNVCLRCSRVSNRPCRNGYPVFLNPYTMLVHFVIHLHLTGGYLCINEKDEAIGNRAILIQRSTVLTRLSPNHHTLMYSHPSKTT